MKILIPTSGIGSRLGNLTKYTNKALIKIGDKAVISHIIDLYPGGEFVVTLGYFGDHVRQFLEIAYPDRKFEFVYVDPYDGPGSGLLKSISFAKDKLQCPFIFHVCDTIIDNTPPTPTYNWMACGVTNSPDLHRTVISNRDRIVKINEKGEIDYDYAYIGVAGVYDYKKFWKELDTVINTKDSSDCHIFGRMLADTKINTWLVSLWFDTGNVESLNKAKRTFTNNYRVLDKYEESIYFLDNNVIKFFTDPKIVEERIERNKILSGLVPQIQKYSKNFYTYKLQEGQPLSEVLTEQKLFSLIEWAEKNLWKSSTIHKSEFTNTCRDFYFYKTLQRVKEYLTITGTSDVPSIINGIEVPDCNEIFSNMDWLNLYDTNPTNFHGDFVLENILSFNNTFTLIDWRQNFGGNLEAGDVYYDLAKLNHNLIFNHEIIDKGGYSLIINNGNVSCDLHRSHNMVIYQQNLLKFLETKNYDVRKIQILSALIWLNMAPLHVYPLNKFLFYFGKYNLWKLLLTE